MYYRVPIKTDAYPRYVAVEFKSDAKTDRGLMRAMAKAIVDKLHTDVFEITGRIYTKRYKDDWPRMGNRLSKADEHEVWRMAHEMLMG